MRLGVRVGLCLRPVAPRMSVERILAIGSEKLHQLQPCYIGEARADADVLEIAVVVVQAEQERADFGFLTALVPAKAGHDAVAISLVFDFEHYTLVRLVGSVRGLRNDAVESRALEASEPIGGSGPVFRCRCEVKRRLRLLEDCLESGASLRERRVAKALIALA